MFVVDESKIVNGTYKGVMQVFSYDNANEIELPWSGQFLVLLRNQFGALPVVDYFEGNRYKLNEAIYHYRGSNVLEFIKVGGTRKTMVLVPLSVQVSAYNMENDGIKGAYIPELEKEIQKVLEVIRNSGMNVTNKEKAFLNNLKFIEKELTDKTNVVFGKVAEVLNEVALVEQESERFLSLVRDNERLVDEKYHKFDTSVTTANQTIDDILALQPQFQAVLDETTGKDVISAPEIILARNGEANLKARLDKDQQQITAQLAQISTNVKLYNAIGDGLNDDTNSIQNAIDFVYSSGGGVVWFPKGVYNITSSIQVPSKVSLKGTGKDNSVLFATGVGYDGIVIENATYVNISDMGVKNVTNEGAGESSCVNIKGLSRFVTISDCLLADSDDAGVRIGYNNLGVAKDVKILNCFIRNSKEGHGIEIMQGEDILCQGNTITGNANQGIRVCGGVEVTIANNHIHDNHQGISIQGFGTGIGVAKRPKKTIIKGNSIKNSQYGINIFNEAEDILIQGNMFINCFYHVSSEQPTGQPENGEYGCKRVNIIGNTNIGGSRVYVFRQKCDLIFIKENHATEYSHSGAYIAGDVKNIFIENNLFSTTVTGRYGLSTWDNVIAHVLNNRFILTSPSYFISKENTNGITTTTLGEVETNTEITVL